MAIKNLGKVTHFYPKIGVAVIDLKSGLSVGDEIVISGSTDFSQVVTSMQVEHQIIDSAKKGDTVGLKVNQAVKPGDIISKN